MVSMYIKGDIKKANKLIDLDPTNIKALYRKGLAHFELSEVLYFRQYNETMNCCI